MRNRLKALTGARRCGAGGRFWPGDDKLKNRLSAGKLLGPIRALT